MTTPKKPRPWPKHRKPKTRGAKARRTIDVVKGNPTVVRGAVVAVLSLLTGLGFTWATDVDPDVVVGILAVLGPIAATLWSRFAVTPNAKVITRVTTTGEVVAGDAAVAPTGTPLTVSTNGLLPEVQSVRINSNLVAPATR